MFIFSTGLFFVAVEGGKRKKKKEKDIRTADLKTRQRNTTIQIKNSCRLLV